MITKDDTRALRQADTLVFHHLPIDRRNGSVGAIRALKKVKGGKAPFEIEETAEHEISVDSEIKDYGKDHADKDALSGAVVLQLVKWADTIGYTLKRILRPGDQVKLFWIRNNDTQNHIDAGLVSDELRMIVSRGKQSYIYLVDTQVGKDNSARMIRYPY